MKRFIINIIISLLIVSLITCTQTNDTKKSPKKDNKETKSDKAKKAFETLSKSKEGETDVEHMRKNKIIDVQALNPATQVSVNDFKVNITQIDNSKFPEVTLAVSITDKDGNPLLVKPDLFYIEENGVTIPKDNIVSIIQKKDTEKKSNYTPLNVLLAIDKSGSMVGNTNKEDQQPLAYAKKAAIEFINQAKKEDIIKVFAFSGDIYPLGINKDAIQGIEKLKPSGDTVLYGVLYESVKELQKGGGVKAVILLTDGRNDTRGTVNPQLRKITLRDGINAADKLAIPVYTIGFGQGADESILKEIALRTHAKYFQTGDKEQISNIYKLIREIISTQYIITYRSKSIQPVTDVKIEIGKFYDRREFTTPEHVIKREKKLREEIQIVKDRQKELDKQEKEIKDKISNLKEQEQSIALIKAKLKEQETTIEAKIKELNQKEKELNNYDERIRKLEAQLKKEEVNLSNLKTDLDSQSATMDEKSKRLNQLEKDQANKEKSLETKDSEITKRQDALEKELNDYKSARAKLTQQQTELENNQASLNKEIKENKTLKDQLNNEKQNLEKEKERLGELKNRLDSIIINIQNKYKKSLDEATDQKKELDKIKP